MRRFFTVWGQPQGKGRARVVSQGGKAHGYTPPKTALYERLVAETYKSSYDGADALRKAVELKIDAFFRVPDSWPRRKKQEALAGLLPVTVKPDCDNILKVIADALNGVAWLDDKQVTFAQVRKAYGAEPRVEIEIWEAVQ